ncbi:MAG TPA: sigma-70 family RNA polymerase sigma factor [Chitinophagaceae bacterium]|jgi:RNA polymerase sigma-70 factor (ECF subfamily)|nr:sigma-70 family RNA polymerase sigma factor [Chitinophagaceae bacterium]
MPLQPLHNETDLLQGVTGGSQQAFEELFNGYHQQLAAFVLLVTGSSELTEEIVQDVFLQVWQKRAALPGIENFCAWLFIITKNKTLNALRNLRLQQEKLRQYRADMMDSSTADLTTAEDEQEYSLLLEEAVAHLPPQQQRVYRLRYQEKLSYAAIAESTGLSPDSVKKYLYWATRFIARHIRSKMIVSLLLLAGLRG